MGLYFFEDEAGRAVTVNSACYTEMLHTFLEPELRRLGVETQTGFSKMGQWLTLRGLQCDSSMRCSQLA